MFSAIQMLAAPVSAGSRWARALLVPQGVTGAQGVRDLTGGADEGEVIRLWRGWPCGSWLAGMPGCKSLGRYLPLQAFDAALNAIAFSHLRYRIYPLLPRCLCGGTANGFVFRLLLLIHLIAPTDWHDGPVLLLMESLDQYVFR